MKKHNFYKKVLIFIILLFFALLWIMPITIALTKSFNINGFKNYIYVLTHEKINYLQVVFNSLFVASATALIVVIITSLAGYSFSKMDFKGKNILYIGILACLTIPIAAVTMPLFFTIKDIGLIDKHAGIILPLVAFNAPMMLLIIKNYFDSIPNSLLESARIDGCNSLQIYRVLMMPLSIPVLANISVLTFVYTWNDYLIPLLIIRDESMYTVTLASQYFMETTYQSPENIAQLYAAMILMTIPSIIVYLCSQKYLQTGLTAGAVKG